MRSHAWFGAGWARLASGPGSRATKYRHLLDDALSLSGAELSVLAVLMLRGPQTPGELRLRTERLHRFATLEELDAVLARLDERRLIVRFDRRPGQKEARWSLGEEFAGAERPGGATPAAAPVAPADEDDLAPRVTALERDLDPLRELVERLRGGER